MADQPPVDTTLKVLSQAELDAVIDRHEKFIAGRSGGLRASLSHHDLSNRSFAKRNLSDADFTGSRLCECNFQGTKLDRAILFCVDLRNSNLYGASLKRADLRGASMRGARLVGANMEGVDLREGSLANADNSGNLEAAHKNLTRADKGGANLSGTNLSDAKLSGAVAIDSNFSDSIMKSTKIKNANLKGANFSGANLERADFDNCDLKDVNLKFAVLTGAAINLSEVSKDNLVGSMTDLPSGFTLKDLPTTIQEMLQLHRQWIDTQGKAGRQLDLSKFDLRQGFDFEGACLTMMRGVEAIFYGTNMSKSQMQAVELKNADVRQVNFERSDMRGGQFVGCRFANACLKQAQLQPLVLNSGITLATNLTGASMRFVDFTGANLQSVKFNGAEIMDAKFLGADLKDADFTGADVTQAVFDDAGAAIIKKFGLTV